MLAVERIKGALRLAPMTIRQLAKCLMIGVNRVRQVLDDLFSRRKVTRYRMQPRQRTNGSPPYFYELRSEKTYRFDGECA